MINITLEQIDNMKHALGRNINKPYRNYFCTNNNDKDWEDLVNKGYAINQNYKINLDDCIYSVSEKGINLLKELIK